MNKKNGLNVHRKHITKFKTLKKHLKNQFEKEQLQIII